MSVSRSMETSTPLPFCLPRPICGEQKWEVNCCIMHPIFYKAPGFLCRYLANGLYGNSNFSLVSSRKHTRKYCLFLAFIYNSFWSVFVVVWNILHFRNIQTSVDTSFFESCFQIFVLSPFITLAIQYRVQKNNVMPMLSFVSPLAVAFIVYLVILRQFSS